MTSPFQIDEEALKHPLDTPPALRQIGPLHLSAATMRAPFHPLTPEELADLEWWYRKLERINHGDLIAECFAAFKLDRDPVHLERARALIDHLLALESSKA